MTSRLVPADVVLSATWTGLPPRCSRVNPLPCIAHRCLHSSRAASTLGAAQFLWRHEVLHFPRSLDVTIAPSPFLAETLETPAGVRLPSVRYRTLWWLRPTRRLVLTVTVSSLCRTPLSREGPSEPVAGSEDSPTPELPLLATVRYAGRSNGRRWHTASNAEFLGHVPSDEVRRHLATCRAAVVPSLCVENAPMIILEAMAAGRPVIASRVGGIPHQVQDGVEGLLLPPGDAPALAAALQRLAEEDDLASAMGEAGRARAVELFSPSAHVEGLIEVYRRAVDRRRGDTTRADALAKAARTPAD